MEQIRLSVGIGVPTNRAFVLAVVDRRALECVGRKVDGRRKQGTALGATHEELIFWIGDDSSLPIPSHRWNR